MVLSDLWSFVGRRAPGGGEGPVTARGRRGPLSLSERPFLSAVIWLSLAAFLALFTWNCRLSTPVEVEVLGDHLRWEVAGSELSLPFSPGRIWGLELRSQQGIGWSGWEEILIGQVETKQRLPAHSGFSWRRRDPPPVGDWWVDAVLPARTLAHYDVDIPSTFTLQTRFHGRFQQDMLLEFEGDEPFSLSFRRGWINNDFFVRDAEGRVLAASSIDPRPLDRVLALLGTLLGALAAGCGIIGLRLFFLPRRRGEDVWRACSGAPEISGKEAEERDPAARNSAGGRPSRRSVFLAVLAVMAFLAVGQSLWTARELLGALPHTPDEVVNLLQARWILDGRLTGELPPCPELEEIPLCYHREGRRIGHYPPAWPLLLALGVGLGMPTLIPALLHGMLILLLGLIGRRMGGEWMGLGAALFALASPLAALLFSSTLSHSGSATLLALTLWLILRGEGEAANSPAVWRLSAAGASLGLAFGIRPLTALVAGLPMMFYLLFPGVGRKDWRGLFRVIVGGTPVILLVFLANARITGTWWHFPYALAGAPMLSPSYLFEGLRNADTLLASLPPLLNGWLWPIFPSGLGLPLGIAIIPFLLKRGRREDRMLLGIALFILLSLLPVRASGLHGYGPRYLFAACIPLWLLQARAFVLLLQGSSFRRFAPAFLAALALVLSALLTLPGRLSLYENYNDVDGRLHQRLSALPEHSLVLVKEDNWRVWAEASPWLGVKDPAAPALALDILPLEEICTCRLKCGLFRWRDGEMIKLGECEAGSLCEGHN